MFAWPCFSTDTVVNVLKNQPGAVFSPADSRCSIFIEIWNQVFETLFFEIVAMFDIQVQGDILSRFATVINGPIPNKALCISGTERHIYKERLVQALQCIFRAVFSISLAVNKEILVLPHHSCATPSAAVFRKFMKNNPSANRQNCSWVHCLTCHPFGKFWTQIK